MGSRFGLVLLFYLVSLIVALLYAVPFWPRTRLGWVLFVLFGPGLLLGGEMLGEVIDREPLGRWVNARTAGRRFSTTRVLYLLARALVLLGLLAVAGWVIQQLAPGVGNFVRHHFGPGL
jgi:hypothetical protein